MTEGNICRQLSTELFARRAISKGVYGNVEDTIALYEQAGQLLDEGNSYGRALLSNAQALAFVARGEVRAGLHALQESASAYEQAGVLTAAGRLSCLASSYLLMLGQLKQAERTLDLLHVKHLETPNQLSPSLGATNAILSLSPTCGDVSFMAKEFFIDRLSVARIRDIGV